MPAPVASVAARGVAPVRAPPRRAHVRSRVVAASSSAPSSDGRAPRPTRDDGDVRCPSAPRRAALALASAAAVAASAPAPPALAGQPIEWVFSGGSGQSIGDIWKDSLEESGIEVKREPKTPPPAAPDDDGSASSSSSVVADASLAAPSPESEPVDVVGTAVKFGKLGAILVFADVVTFFIMGRSVLGVMDDGGEEGWKEKVADEIMARAKEKQKGTGGGGDDEAKEEEER